MDKTEKKRGGSGAKLDAQFHPGVGRHRSHVPFGGQEAVGFPNAIYRVWGPFMAGTI